jgi:hypothetical protein
MYYVVLNTSFTPALSTRTGHQTGRNRDRKTMSASAVGEPVRILRRHREPKIVDSQASLSYRGAPTTRRHHACHRHMGFA